MEFTTFYRLKPLTPNCQPMPVVLLSKSRVCFIGLLLMHSLVYGQIEIANVSVPLARLRQHVFALADDSLQGRKTGTGGLLLHQGASASSPVCRFSPGFNPCIVSADISIHDFRGVTIRRSPYVRLASVQKTRISTWSSFA